jgi:hypothetical protein
MKNEFDPSDENRPLAPLSPPSAAMGEGLGVFRGRFFENKASHCLKIETNRGSRSEERCLIQMN